MWAGSILAIPPGFVLCDGTNGTPDLRNRFIVGAGAALNPGYTAGTSMHDHLFFGELHGHDLVPGIGDLSVGTDFNDPFTQVMILGTTDESSTLPPYFSLCYLMKVT